VQEHTLHNFEHAAALQYVRKISETTKPSNTNTKTFERPRRRSGESARVRPTGSRPREPAF